MSVEEPHFPVPEMTAGELRSLFASPLRPQKFTDEEREEALNKIELSMILHGVEYYG